jgi:hypothetical protein
MKITKLVLAAMLSLFIVPAGALASQSGAYVSNGDLAQFESVAGGQVDIQAVFIGWGSNGAFPSYYKSNVAGKGKTLLIFWEPTVNYDSINSGQWDSYLQAFAASAKNYGGPVILAPFHEMNGNWDVWDGTVGSNTPQKMITAWKRVHNFFGSAENVKFGWAVNNVSEPNTEANAITAYYPGSDYVDYVGVDGFNFANPWESWQSVFSASLNTVKQYGKPVYIFSTASCQGTKKAQWINEMAVGVKQYGLAGWIWFNENKECDWRINSDAASLTAFRSLLLQAPAGTVPTTQPSSGTITSGTTSETGSNTTDSERSRGTRHYYGSRSSHR